MRFYLQVLLPILVIFSASCRQEKHFISRKYTKGHYFEKIAKKDHTEKLKTTQNKNEASPLIAEKNSDLKPALNPVPSQENSADLKTKSEEKNLPLSEKKLQNSSSLVLKFHASKQIEKAIEKLYLKKQVGPAESDDSMQILPIVAFVCGVLALLTQIAAFVISIAAIEISPLFIVGFALAIAGIVLGIIGLIKSKDSTVNANKVFSVLGLSIGGGSLILGLVLLLYAFIIVSMLSGI